jgi:hypothetical protein
VHEAVLVGERLVSTRGLCWRVGDVDGVEAVEKRRQGPLARLQCRLIGQGSCGSQPLAAGWPACAWRCISRPTYLFHDA